MSPPNYLGLSASFSAFRWSRNWFWRHVNRANKTLLTCGQGSPLPETEANLSAAFLCVVYFFLHSRKRSASPHRGFAVPSCVTRMAETAETNSLWPPRPVSFAAIWSGIYERPRGSAISRYSLERRSVKSRDVRSDALDISVVNGKYLCFGCFWVC